ncbi:MAG: lysophospholipid acyltransferase family protein [Rickettsiales bacterium]
MNLIRTLLFYILFILETIIVGTSGLLFVFINKKYAFVTSKTWAKVALFLAKYICGLDYKVENYYKLPSYIIASKHQSTFETLLFWTLVDNPAYIIKKELLKIPVFGHYLKYTGMISIDRKAGRESIKKILKTGEEYYQKERNLIIFPEGTRTSYGKETIRYSSGVYAIYDKFQKPVIPVALNTGKFWSNKRFTIRPGTITIKYLPQIKPGLPKDKFIDSLRDSIESESAKL